MPNWETNATLHPADESSTGRGMRLCPLLRTSEAIRSWNVMGL